MSLPLSPSDDADLTAKLGHRFSDPKLLEQALTHPSLSGGRGHGKGGASPYERLEFLGDRVLGLVVAEWLYTLFPSAKEGELAKRHAALVNRDALHEVAVAIELEHYLRFANGDATLHDKRKNLTTLADAMEALIGALYLDAGLDTARAFIKLYWREAAASDRPAPVDPKTALQEWAQGRGLPLPCYKVIESSGAAHEPKFVIQLEVKGYEAVAAEGRSKREAEKAAAQLFMKQQKS